MRHRGPREGDAIWDSGSQTASRAKFRSGLTVPHPVLNPAQAGLQSADKDDVTSVAKCSLKPRAFLAFPEFNPKDEEATVTAESTANTRTWCPEQSHAASPCEVTPLQCAAAAEANTDGSDPTHTVSAVLSFTF